MSVSSRPDNWSSGMMGGDGPSSITPFLKIHRFSILAVNFPQHIADFPHGRLRSHRIEHGGHEIAVFPGDPLQAMQSGERLPRAALLFSRAHLLGLAPFHSLFDLERFDRRPFGLGESVHAD